MNAEESIKLRGHFMTTTFIVYIVIALILIGLINVLFQNQAKDQKVEQRSTKDSENQSYQSKFKSK